MPGYSVQAANQALDALAGSLNTPVNVLGFVNLAATDPGNNGAAESASTRQACSWNAAATRQKTNSSALTFTGHAAGTPQTHFRTDSASTAGTFGISGALGSSVTAATITVAAGALVISG
jgi:hypothetical protein